MPLEVGDTVLHYRVLEPIGEGGMGQVFLVEDIRLGRRVALKMLPDRVADDPNRRARFAREARAVAALSHPGIVTIHSVEELDGLHFLTMEHVAGATLESVIPDGGLPLDRFFTLATGIVDAVAAAHREGVIHRDLKSSNIMVGDDGRTKVLDFGLARMTGGPVSDIDATMSADMTEAGAVLGTPAWMSPEQAEGRAADCRSDVFALGVVMYELLSGSSPFRRDSTVSTLAAVIHDQPPPLETRRPDVPRDVSRIIDRCLAKDPEARYASAAELLDALRHSRDRHLTPSVGVGAIVRSWKVALPVGAIAVAVVAAIVWWTVEAHEQRRVRNELVPRIEALADEGDHFEAFLLAREARTVLPDDPTVAALYERSTIPVVVTTDPEGAEVWFRQYRDVDREWLRLGVTPIEDQRVPMDHVRVRIEKPGFEPLELAGATYTGRLHAELVPIGEGPPGMVRVPAGGAGAGRAEPLELPAFWIDRYEVTNRDFQAFVDDGGYGQSDLWLELVGPDASSAGLRRAVEEFVDTTGRPGPAGWILGRFPDTVADQPVAGVSWFEAAAYARWAGKALPTVHHWRRAAGLGAFADILTTSNFGSAGPVAVGALPSLGPFGTHDMAGNVKEWCWNAVGSERYTLGGAWNEPSYEFMDADARSPYDRNLNQGFRCVRYDAPPPHESLAPIEAVRHDFSRVEPVSDEIFDIFTGFFDYERAPLDARVERVDDTATWWRRETVSFSAAYDADRMIAHLYLPRNAEPPHQVVVYRPGAAVNWLTRIDDFGSSVPEFLMRSGRAVAVPAYWGTLERGGGRPIPDGAGYRNRVIRQVNDARRTVDYLETRSDIDAGRLAYVGLSAGGEYGAIYVAVESRFDVAAFLAGGFHDSHMLGEPREVNPWHYAPRVRIPVLMVNGDNDFTLPVTTAQKPLANLLGTPDEHVRHVILKGGHVPADRPALIREVLDWLDRYLGPVETVPLSDADRRGP